MMMGNSKPGMIPPVGSTSASDILSTLKNIVTAINNATQTQLSINGTLNAANISAPTVVKNSSGRLAAVSVITAGTTLGIVYDSAVLTGTGKPLASIPNIVGVFSAPLPASFGILVVPGAGQVITVGYS